MIPTLVNNPLFRGITPEKLLADLEEISFHTRSYKKGEILARQGDVCNRLVILTKGSVRGEMIDYSGESLRKNFLPIWKRSVFIHVLIRKEKSWHDREMCATVLSS